MATVAIIGAIAAAIGALTGVAKVGIDLKQQADQASASANQARAANTMAFLEDSAKALDATGTAIDKIDDLRSQDTQIS